MKNDQYKLILGRSLKNILHKINDDISSKLLYLDDNSDFGFSISYINITNKEDHISFTPSKKVIEINNNVRNPNIWDSCRNDQKIGRFISKILNEDPQTIEKFVNKFKSEFKIINNLNCFDIVKGDDIIKYYNGNSYIDGGGSLNKSCMRHSDCSPYFNFYKVNDDKVKMLILYDNINKNKIMGRALIWNVDEPDIILMDRIYTSNDSDQNLFIKYAIENGWYYKKTQSFNEESFINDKNEIVNINCKIKINKDKYEYFPYLDTFQFYDNKNYYITNNINEYTTNKYSVKLRSTNGRDQGNENFVFDYFNNDMVISEDTVYCDIGDTRILKNDAIKYSKDVYAIPSTITYSLYDNKIHIITNVIWSSYHQDFINKKESIKVYFDKDKKYFDIIHSDLLEKEFNYAIDKDEYFINELLTKSGDGNYYIKDEYNKIDNIKNKNENKNYDDFMSFFQNGI
jgi:hypothetical protein